MSTSNEQPPQSAEAELHPAFSIIPIEEEAAASEDEEKRTLEGLSILLVEDQVLLQVLGTKILKGLGATVSVANNGVKAVEAMTSMIAGEKAKREAEAANVQEGSISETSVFPHYDLILMDCKMPEMNGYEATREIRKMESEAKMDMDILIIAFTSNAPSENGEDCFAAGMDAYMQKPANADVMASTILSKLSEKRNRISSVAEAVENTA